MSTQKKLMTQGILMLGSFFVVLAVIFSPIFPGKINGLAYMDNLFNTISKGSSYFIPKVLKDNEKYAGKTINTTISMGSEQQAVETALLYQKSGADVVISGKALTIKGDFAKIMSSCLSDADYMFKNDGKPVADKYGIAEQKVLFYWWSSLKAISANLSDKKDFELVKPIANIQQKALEPAYNYYKIDTRHWQENILLIVASLGFYVFYTMWYGFGLLHIFEGCGLKIGH
jgi:hypothetical protein